MSVATYRYRTSRVTMGTLFFLLGVAFMADSVGILRFTLALFWPLFLVSVGAGMLLRRARRLQVEEGRSSQLSVAEERVRIARELHDVVAHGVSLMTIQISAARRVGATKPEAAEESLVAAEHTGRQTLTELDTMLGALRGADASIGAAAGPPLPAAMSGPRPPAELARSGRPGDGGRAPLPRLADISRLVDAFRQAGRAVTFETLGDPPQVSPSTELAVYRLVSEALTNAARYAPDSPVEVQLIYSPTAISVFVDDQGTASPPPSRTGGGHGLLGCSERLAALGATLEAGPRNPGPGWRVHAKVPLLI